MPETDSDRTPDSDEIEELIGKKVKKKILLKVKSKQDVNKESNNSGGRPLSNMKCAAKLHEISDSDSDDNFSKPQLSKISETRIKNDTKVETKTDAEIRKKIFETERKIDTQSAEFDNRPKCKYGGKCYRKNPEHLKAFSHSFDESPSRNTKYVGSPDIKKRKLQKEEEPRGSKSCRNLLNFYLTNVNGISNEFNSGVSLDIKDLLSTSRGKLKASAQFNYMCDIPWLMQQYPEAFRKCPLLIVHGEQRDAKTRLEKSASGYPNIKFCQAKLEILYGTHHTKMMLLLYEEGLKVIIHTSNLIHGDWFQKTQGMWVSPLFPLLKGGPSVTDGDSITKFKSDLIEYLTAYNCKELDEWCLNVKKHDLSQARVFLIGSVPGRHIGSKKTSFGHLKLRKILHSNGPLKEQVSSKWPVIGQFSSIGSLGSNPDQWLCAEWLTSLATVKSSMAVTQSAPLKLIYPSVDNVRISLEGYPAGASLPYSIKVASKQQYLKDFLHQWKSRRFGRSEASPHIKTYCRLSPDNKQIAWFLVTSANLSKAAWGALEKKGSQLMIRSYELGVLYIPLNYGLQDLFCVPEAQLDNKCVTFPLPYDVPLTPYSSKDEPWIWDIPHVYAPDRNGNKWCPP